MLGQRIWVELNWADAGFWKGTSYTVCFPRVGASFDKLVDLEVEPLFSWKLVLLLYVSEDGALTDA